MQRILLIISAFIGLGMTAQIGKMVELEVPAYFPESQYDFGKNPLTEEKIALGQALFYDPILSLDSSISCASCHSPYHAFAHTDHDLSHGIHDSIGRRNAPALFNLAWQSSLMWDGAINHLDMQALAPISDGKEMGEKLPHVLTKLRRKAIYPALFAQAFGDSSITGERLLKAFTQFQLSLVSAHAKYDQVQEQQATFTEQEEKGYRVYQANCSSCHPEPLFSTYTFANNGLPVDTSLNDFGKGEITAKQADMGKFKIPSLRNLSYTFPYMHDGRFRKLKEVVNHYNSLDKGSLSDVQNPIRLSPHEQVDLIAFLLTLNDKSFVFDPRNKFPKVLLP